MHCLINYIKLVGYNGFKVCLWLVVATIVICVLSDKPCDNSGFMRLMILDQ